MNSDRSRSEPRSNTGRYGINLNEEQQPFKKNRFKLAEPVPAGKEDNDSPVKPGDMSMGSRKSPKNRSARPKYEDKPL